MADDFDRLKRTFDNPGTRALLGLASIAGFALYAGKIFSTSEGRRGYLQQVRRSVAERRERDAWHERKNKRTRAKLDYFNGRGGELWSQRALIVIGPESPFADATFEYLRGGFRQTRFVIRSCLVGAELHAGFDSADRNGGISLGFDDGRKWSLGVWAGQRDFRQYESAETLPDVVMARFACRMLAAPGCPFSTITLVLPESSEIRNQIWRDYVVEHPELEEEEWPW